MADDRIRNINLVLATLGALLLLYVVGYSYYRQEGFVEHDERYDYVNYSKGFSIISHGLGAGQNQKYGK
jgi:hypothetical protein